MKKLILTSILFFLVFKPNSINAQNEEAAVAAVAAGLFALGASAAAIEQLKEQVELKATEFLLGHNDEFSHFAISCLSLDEVKSSDLSNLSIVSFEVQKYNPKTMQQGMGKKVQEVKRPGQRGFNKGYPGKFKVYVPNGEKFILLMITDPGWVNEYGVDYSEINWLLLDYEEWNNMMVSYVKTASEIEDDDLIRKNIMEGEIVNKGVKLDKTIAIPFRTLREDMYAVNNYDDKIKLVYNERGLGIFLKNSKRLVQLKRKTLIRLSSFIKP
jgi:hypothetical protein